MRKVATIIILLVTVLLIQTSCAVKWTDAIHFGQVSQAGFNETIDIEIRKNLLFIPITLSGKEYLFLFDSGAPLSISEELQRTYSFKKISSGNIIDSDHNRKKVNWVQVDTIHVGSIAFTNQTAFVGDFLANPLLKCLGIDGIVGSNLMRNCNWSIDQEQQRISLSSTIDETILQESVVIPFRTDEQYNIYVNLNIGQALIRNLLLDYGSNGSVALNKEIFTTLEDRGIIGETLLEKGVQQTGIIGEPIEISTAITQSDSVRIDELILQKVEIKTGNTSLIGNKVLSRFTTTIDWHNKNLILSEREFKPEFNPYHGFRIGYTPEKGVYIRSVIENSKAQELGVIPNMQVAKFDSLDFEKGNDFCDYLQAQPGNTVFLELINSSGQRQEYLVDRIGF